MKIVNPVIFVIDVQNDLCSKEGIASKAGYDTSNIRKIIPNISKFIGGSRKEGVPIVFIISHYDKEYLTYNIMEFYFLKGFDNFCNSKSNGSDFYKIKPKSGDKIIIKHRYDAFINPDLDVFLKKNNIKTIILTGCQTDVCVDSTARSAFMKGYNIILIKGCLASLNESNHKYSLKFMQDMYNAQLRDLKPLRKNK